GERRAPRIPERRLEPEALEPSVKDGVGRARADMAERTVGADERGELAERLDQSTAELESDRLGRPAVAEPGDAFVVEVDHRDEFTAADDGATRQLNGRAASPRRDAEDRSDARRRPVESIRPPVGAVVDRDGPAAQAWSARPRRPHGRSAVHTHIAPRRRAGARRTDPLAPEASGAIITGR